LLIGEFVVVENDVDADADADDKGWWSLLLFLSPLMLLLDTKNTTKAVIPEEIIQKPLNDGSTNKSELIHIRSQIPLFLKIRFIALLTRYKVSASSDSIGSRMTTPTKISTVSLEPDIRQTGTFTLNLKIVSFSVVTNAIPSHHLLLLTAEDGVLVLCLIHSKAVTITI
jgi:hypothetical protein